MITTRSLGILGLILLSVALSACSGSGPGETFQNQGAQHIADDATFDGYNSVPPTSGPHWGAPAPWGISTSPLPNERQVHNLEHGGVIIQYNTEDQELINNLTRFAQKQPNFPCFLIVAPYPDMPFTIAITAWPGKPALPPSQPTYLDGVRDTMDAYDEERLQEFISAYREKGPERVRCI